MPLNIGVISTGAIGQEHIRRCSKVLQGGYAAAVTADACVAAQLSGGIAPAALPPRPAFYDQPAG
jgi:hypothetical protein